MRTFITTLLVGIGLLGLGWGTTVHASSNATKKADSSALVANQKAPKWDLKPELLCNTFLSDGGACRGKRRTNKTRRTLLITGGTMFGGAYLSAISAVLAADHEGKWLGTIPVLGPFMMVSQLLALEQGTSASTVGVAILKAQYAAIDHLASGLLIAAGVVQATSVLLLTVGFLVPTFKNPLAFRYGKTTTVQINPVTGPSMTGLSISGTM